MMLIGELPYCLSNLYLKLPLAHGVLFRYRYGPYDSNGGKWNARPDGIARSAFEQHR
jgi:hypothetical protein